MDALLIAPADRPEVSLLAEVEPLALAPILGKPLATYWLEHLVTHGADRVRLLASDRADLVRSVLGDGSRWGLRLEIIAEAAELAADHARAKYPAEGGSDGSGAPAAHVMDHLPELPHLPLFQGYTAWFAALEAWIGRAATSDRIGAREIQPGVWLGMHSHLAPGARLLAPAWIGEHVMVGAGSVIGPYAVLEDRVLVGSRSIIARSVIGPETCVGDLVRVDNSLARHNLLLNWQSGSSLRVPDSFLLSRLTVSGIPAGPHLPFGRIRAAFRNLLRQPKPISLPLRPLPGSG